MTDLELLASPVPKVIILFVSTQFPLILYQLGSQIGHKCHTPILGEFNEKIVCPGLWENTKGWRSTLGLATERERVLLPTKTVALWSSQLLATGSSWPGRKTPGVGNKYPKLSFLLMVETSQKQEG